jgi:hypothetical protein
MFVFLSDFKLVDDQVTYKRFEGSDHARSIKEKLGLEDTDFITALTDGELLFMNVHTAMSDTW